MPSGPVRPCGPGALLGSLTPFDPIRVPLRPGGPCAPTGPWPLQPVRSGGSQIRGIGAPLRPAAPCAPCGPWAPAAPYRPRRLSRLAHPGGPVGPCGPMPPLGASGRALWTFVGRLDPIMKLGGNRGSGGTAISGPLVVLGLFLGGGAVLLCFLAPVRFLCFPLLAPLASDLVHAQRRQKCQSCRAPRPLRRPVVVPTGDQGPATARRGSRPGVPSGPVWTRC